MRRSVRFILEGMIIMAVCFFAMVIDLLPLPVLIIVVIVAWVLFIINYLNNPVVPY